MAMRGNPQGYEMIGGTVSDWVLRQWQIQALRRMQIADKAAADWERRKPQIEEFIQARLAKLNGGRVDDYEFRNQLEANWTLKDLIKKHEWNREEANRYHNAILAQHALRQMLGGEK